MANQIQLKGDFRREEALASVATKPGYLIQIDSAGKFKPHATQGGYAERIVAVEDALQGNNLADTYAIGDLVSANVVEPGAEALVFIKAGQNIAIGDFLVSNGDGTLIENGQEASGVTVKQIIAVAVAANDLSASGAVDTRSAVRFL